MDACRGKKSRIKHIHRTYSSCHRWWNKICRQLISVTNCRDLVCGFKVFPSRSGGGAAGSAVRVWCLPQVACQPWPHNVPYVWPAAAWTPCTATGTSAARPSARLPLPALPFCRSPLCKSLFPSLVETQKWGRTSVWEHVWGSCGRQTGREGCSGQTPLGQAVAVLGAQGRKTCWGREVQAPLPPAGVVCFMWMALILTWAIGCRNGSH